MQWIADLIQNKPNISQYLTYQVGAYFSLKNNNLAHPYSTPNGATVLEGIRLVPDREQGWVNLMLRGRD